MTAYRQKLYRPDDVRRILARASELRARDAPAARAEGPTRTLKEIEALGTELGIDPEFVRRAAGDDGEGEASQPVSLFTGGPARILLERQIAGAITAADHARLARLLRRATGDAGAPQPLGDALTWTSRMPARQLVVHVEPDEGGVYVRVEESLQALRGQMFGGLLGGMGGGGIAVVMLLVAEIAPMLMPVAAVAWVFGVYLLARKLYASRAAVREREARRLVDAISAAVAAAAPAAARQGREEARDEAGTTRAPGRRVGPGREADAPAQAADYADDEAAVADIEEEHERARRRR